MSNLGGWRLFVPGEYEIEEVDGKKQLKVKKMAKLKSKARYISKDEALLEASKSEERLFSVYLSPQDVKELA